MSKSKDLSIDKTIGDVISSIRKPKLQPETGWWIIGPAPNFPRDVVFEGSWDHTDINTWPVSWYQSHHGEVRLRGKALGGTEGTVIFYLPEEDRPENEETFIVNVGDDGSIDLSGIKFRAWELGDI